MWQHVGSDKHRLCLCLCTKGVIAGAGRGLQWCERRCVCTLHALSHCLASRMCWNDHCTMNHAPQESTAQHEPHLPLTKLKYSMSQSSCATHTDQTGMVTGVSAGKVPLGKRQWGTTELGRDGRVPTVSYTPPQFTKYRHQESNLGNAFARDSPSCSPYHDPGPSNVRTDLSMTLSGTKHKRQPCLLGGLNADVSRYMLSRRTPVYAQGSPLC